MSKYRSILICLTLAGAAILSGCTIGYRYHNLDSQITSAGGANAQVEGDVHMIELGIVLDFRYFRLASPFLGSTYEYQVRDEKGGSSHTSAVLETRGMRLDAPLLSVWSEDDGFGPGYPGIMVHRHSVELWASGTARLTELPLWWADAGIVYYHHDLVAVRAFGGWGGIPFDGATTRYGPDGPDYEFFETTAQGFTGGVELTLGAGEQALDFIKFFMDNQEAAGKPPR